ncbi:MAG: single-stranded DNA-binding protein [Saprospiraceae bacterium]
MKNLFNTVQLIGHLGQKPEIFTLETGRMVARVSLATNEQYYSSSGEKVNNTSWHNLVAWDKKANFLEKYFAKGNRVLVHGRIATRQYEDKNGIKRNVTEVIVSDLMKFDKSEVEY